MRVMKRKNKTILRCFYLTLAPLLFAVLLAACGDDDGDPVLPDGSMDTGVDPVDADLEADAEIEEDSTVINLDGGDECSGVVCDPECAVYVDSTVSTPGNGETPQTALAKVTPAVEAAVTLAGACCTCRVRVAEGRYHIYQKTSADTLFLRERVSVYGGYPRGFGEPRNPEYHPTILDGQQAGEGPNHVYHVVTGSNEAILDGFVITGGRARSDGNPLNPENYGGGLIALNNSPTINDCVFEGNEAVYGGGAYLTNSTTTLRTCRFVENIADEWGGGLHVHSGAPTLSRSDLRLNQAKRGAGLYCGPGAEMQVSNTTFWSNTATNEGGGVYVDLATPLLINNSFSDNSAAAGGALYANGSAHPVVTNSVMWGDIPNEIGKDTSSTVTATYSNVQGGCTVVAGCTTEETGNMDLDPRFLDENNGDLRLWVSSPVVDKGDNAALDGITIDQSGDPRILDGDNDNDAVVDFGAYELGWTLENMPVIHVDGAASGANDGTSWDDAYFNLQHALQAAAAYQQIWVATGVYTPSDLGDQDASFVIPAGVFVFGGFAPSQGVVHMTIRDPETYETVLSGDIMGDDGVGIDQNNSHHVVRSGHNSELDGFTISDGYTIGMGGAEGSCLQVAPGHFFTARSCRFTNCTAAQGGAVWAGNGSLLTLDGCDLVENSATLGGGGAVMLVNSARDTLIKDCTFDSNVSAYGGGLLIDGGDGVTIDGCTFLNNSANWVINGGGGIRAQYVADLLVTGSTITGNTAGVGAGVVLSGCTGSIIENTTIDSNNANDSSTINWCDSSYKIVRAAGGGVFLEGGDAMIQGSTIVDNHAIQSGGNSCNHPDYKYFLGVGGGVFARDAALDIVGTTFSGNEARHTGTTCLGGAGGGVAAYETTVRMVNTLFWNNSASVDSNPLNLCVPGGGGGFWSYHNQDVKVANCAFAGNTASHGGGGFFVSHSIAHMYGVTATANSGSYYGSGAYLNTGELYLYNSIFWGNSGISPNYSQVSVSVGGECYYNRKVYTYYTNIYNTATGNGCLAGCTGSYGACVQPRHFDPGFVDPGASPPNVRLQNGGAAVNAGSNDTAYQATDWLDIDNDGDITELVPLDPDGNLRRNGIMDLGAYERP